MGCGDFKGDDVDTLSYTVNVACICGVPEGSDMALVGLGGEKQLQGNVGGGGWMVQEGVRLVVRLNLGS